MVDKKPDFANSFPFMPPEFFEKVKGMQGSTAEMLPMLKLLHSQIGDFIKKLEALDADSGTDSGSRGE